jgi:hypothetical protein
VHLRWTATGDDGDVGTATSYVLRFSETEITDNNWDSCATMGVGFAPHSAGRVEEAILDMPDPGAVYFFVIRAQDEAGNLGPLSNVAVARSYQLDSDRDGMPDQWETTYDLNPSNGADGELDADEDGLTNRQEFDLGINPAAWDTDGDGASDRWEIENGFNPCSAQDGSADPDHDGLTNLQEYQLGRNALVPDRPYLRASVSPGSRAVTVSIEDVLGRSVTLEVSTSLTRWEWLTNFSGMNSTIHFEDSTVINSSQRFYRVKVE